MKKHAIQTLIETAQYFFEKMPASEAQTNITVKITEVLKDLKAYKENLPTGEMVSNSVNGLEIASKAVGNIANLFPGIIRLDLLTELNQNIEIEIANTEAQLGTEYIVMMRAEQEKASKNPEAYRPIQSKIMDNTQPDIQVNNDTGITCWGTRSFELPAGSNIAKKQTEKLSAYISNEIGKKLEALNTETEFKPGDRVKVLGFKKLATIQKIEICALVKFENATVITELTTPLTNLTHIPNENHTTT